jgi:hypothetical protein
LADPVSGYTSSLAPASRAGTVVPGYTADRLPARSPGPR